MQEKISFEYAVIRLVPRVEREEFLNVGIIVYCPARKFLQAAFAISQKRLQIFAAHLEFAEIEKHLAAFELICAGGASAGAIGKLSLSGRFRWLTAPRSTIIQTSPVHTGLCFDANATLERLLDTLVR